jgi:hypothetical protein
MHRQPRARVNTARDLVAGRHVTVNPVLGTEQRDQLHPRRRAQHVDGAVQIAIHPRRIGNQADAFALQGLKPAAGENFIAKLDLGCGNQGQGQH